MGFGAVLGLSRLSLTRHRSADQRPCRLHVRADAYVDAVGHRVLRPSVRQLPGRLGRGRLYDIQGNYDLMWWIAVGLGVFAALIHWWIREQPVPRLSLAAAPA